jgi:hypothetical protein
MYLMKKFFIGSLLLYILLINSGCTMNAQPEVDEEKGSLDSIDKTALDTENNQEDKMGQDVLENDVSEEESVDGIQENINQQLATYGLPLVGENIFDPKTIQVGDSIIGFKLLVIHYTAATIQYPYDTVAASFQGETTLVGTISHTVGEFDEQEIVSFTVNEDYLDQLPVSHHDIRISMNHMLYLLIDNPEEIIETFHTEPGDVIENATIKINNYIYVYIPSEITNSATFVE